MSVVAGGGEVGSWGLPVWGGRVRKGKGSEKGGFVGRRVLRNFFEIKLKKIKSQLPIDYHLRYPW